MDTMLNMSWCPRLFVAPAACIPVGCSPQKRQSWWTFYLDPSLGNSRVLLEWRLSFPPAETRLAASEVEPDARLAASRTLRCLAMVSTPSLVSCPNPSFEPNAFTASATDWQGTDTSIIVPAVCFEEASFAFESGFYTATLDPGEEDGESNTDKVELGPDTL